MTEKFLKFKRELSLWFEDEETWINKIKNAAEEYLLKVKSWMKINEREDV